jgi:hypothetical protein
MPLAKIVSLGSLAITNLLILINSEFKITFVIIALATNIILKFPIYINKLAETFIILTITPSTLFTFSMPEYIKPNIIPYYIAPGKSVAFLFNAVFNIILEFRNLPTNNLYILIINKPLKLKFTD